MKKKTKPVPAWETAGRGLKADPKHLMDTCVQPNYPTKIQATLNSLTAEEQKQIKALFNHYVPGIEDCGDVVFTSEEYDTLLNEFEAIDDQQKSKFVELFFDLNILELQENEATAT